jgi:succinyl-diaminopimelate desuccinylase
MALNPVTLSIDLMRCPSVTPIEGGALVYLAKTLAPMGFTIERFPFEDVDNLYARVGRSGKNLCFAGHTDVVPPGDLSAWRIDPFKPEVIDGILYGRGAVDMKGAIACFVAATSEFLERHPTFDGSISFLITGDEEGVAINGTQKVLEALKAKGETIDHCIVGEPTNPAKLGEMLKIGRRGSVTFRLNISGVQGHVAYPKLADNPLFYLIEILRELQNHHLDNGTAHFDPSNLEVTSIDVGNKADNVIPAKATATFNIRFNDTHSSQSLIAWVEGICKKIAPKNYELLPRITGEAFLTQPGEFSALVVDAVKTATGMTPELSTTGGTSDARFIKDYCPVVEFGLINKTAHKVDECIAEADLYALTKIYCTVLERYFNK